MAKLNKQKFNKKLKDKYGKRPDINFWKDILYMAYKDGYYSINRIYKLCNEMVKANQYIK